MKLVPPYLRNCQSDAEHKLFNLLKKSDLGPDWTVFHSVNVSEHQYKQWCEIDFLIVSPKAVLALEVKGGGVRFEDGIWYFTNRYRKENRKSEGPFDQARTGMFALKEEIEKAVGSSVLKNVLFGWGVVFPDMSWSQYSTEMPRELVLDSLNENSEKKVAKYIANLIEYWLQKQPHKSQNTPLQVLNKIKNAIRPNFDVAPSLGVIAKDIASQIVSLTEDQYLLIDSIEDSPRIICEGGAGTGKTFLALEAARRELFAGRGVLVICRSPHLRSFIQAQLTEPIGVYDYAQLQALAGRGQLPSAEVVIVDEGQDLLSWPCIEIISAVLEGGIEEGRWRWFMDFNNQSGFYGAPDSELHDLLKSAGGVVVQKLKRNCRNTEPIVLQTHLTTGGDIGQSRVEAAGPKVRYHFVRNSDEVRRKIAEELAEWEKLDVGAGDMALLSLSTDTPLMEFLPNRWKASSIEMTPAVAGADNNNRLVVSSVSNFKGLERPFVILVSWPPPPGSEVDIPPLYTGMTRANMGLSVVLPEDHRAKIEEMQQSNIALITPISGGSQVGS
jgi:hypothetical protein